MSTTRVAAHAGSWYPSSDSKLRSNLSTYLSTPSSLPPTSTPPLTPLPPTSTPIALISPHAGYSYSGPTAGPTYSLGLQSRLENTNLPSLKTIYVLHPSHHVYLPGVARSVCEIIETPLGNLKVDVNKLNQLSTDLSSAGINVQEINAKTDSKEHSSEMQYPFIKYLIEDSDVQIVPLMIGSSNDSSVLGEVLARYIFEATAFTIVSSDFCHWGSRFEFTPFSNFNDSRIGKSITEMDFEGMSEIEKCSPGGFAEYLRRTGNTICGRYPIQGFLGAVDVLRRGGGGGEIRFVKYAKSGEVSDQHDSSVSYAGGIMYV
ncbi:hypothetical protein TrLO_g11156 [Triparma laevis f. longispina]|uniref:AmmeMemoRadiSam system protein B n=1 Tax=Triparma laevis f. longispina TaxID=1714387 RepID=A0A9W7E6S8_9STRA|nr:hypothetical protein TrLO_g11156 [Triparma laevis f. longispina]